MTKSGWFQNQPSGIIFQLDHANFHVDKTVVALAGSEVAVEVTYEPTAIGESFTMLVLNSNIGGEYRFPLYGTCLFPKPQVSLYFAVMCAKLSYNNIA